MAFHISFLNVNRGLLASFLVALVALAATLLFHFSQVLLADLPPHGNMSCGIKIPVGMLLLTALLPLEMSVSSVLVCVNDVLSLGVVL